MSEASAEPSAPAISRSTSGTTGSRAPAIITPKQSVKPVLATACPAAGTSLSLSSETKRPNSAVKEAIANPFPCGDKAIMPRQPLSRHDHTAADQEKHPFIASSLFDVAAAFSASRRGSTQAPRSGILVPQVDWLGGNMRT